MVLGAALILAALSLLMWNRQEDRQAGAMAERVLPIMVQELKAPVAESDSGTENLPDPYALTMTEAEIEGYSYVGFLSISSIGLELPVMAQWDYGRLKIAPCRYTGSTKTDDLVICAHNYVRHFGPIRKLNPGDKVLFTDMDGETWHYQVAAVEILEPTAIEEMTAGDYDLTLFTCTYGGRSRVTVRCSRVTE